MSVNYFPIGFYNLVPFLLKTNLPDKQELPSISRPILILSPPRKFFLLPCRRVFLPCLGSSVVDRVQAVKLGSPLVGRQAGSLLGLWTFNVAAIK
jgi:hypothetical protein